MKVKFAICDDNAIDSSYVKELVIKWSNQKKYQVNIDVFCFFYQKIDICSLFYILT